MITDAVTNPPPTAANISTLVKFADTLQPPPPEISDALTLVPEPAVTTPPPPAVTEPEVVTPPVPDGAARRIAAKVPKIEELNSKIAEWETKYKTAEDQLNEIRTAKEAAEAKRLEIETSLAAREREMEEVKGRWQKETDPVFNPDELEEVRPILDTFRTNLRAMIPADIGAEDEEPQYTDADKILKARGGDMLKCVQDFVNVSQRTDFDAAKKGTYHRALISVAAKIFGVPDKAFESGDLDGSEFGFLSTRHPAYKHLRTWLPAAAQSWMHLEGARQHATQNQGEAINRIYDQRLQKNEKFLRDSGITDSLEEVENRLKKNPDDATSIVVKALLADPEQAKALKEAIRNEALASASAHLDIRVNENDPKKRDALIKANHSRLIQRAVHAPISGLSVNLAAKLLKQVSELKEKLSKYETQADDNAAAADPGTIAVRPPTPPSGAKIAGFPAEILASLRNTA